MVRREGRVSFLQFPFRAAPGSKADLDPCRLGIRSSVGTSIHVPPGPPPCLSSGLGPRSCERADSRSGALRRPPAAPSGSGARTRAGAGPGSGSGAGPRVRHPALGVHLSFQGFPAAREVGQHLDPRPQENPQHSTSFPGSHTPLRSPSFLHPWPFPEFLSRLSQPLLQKSRSGPVAPLLTLLFPCTLPPPSQGPP